jgi:hypothetical protein
LQLIGTLYPAVAALIVVNIIIIDARGRVTCAVKTSKK